MASGTAVALDENGTVYISYYDTGDGVLKVAFNKNGKWYGEVLARDFAGFTSSVQVRDGMLWVAFADDANGAFKVAHRPLDTPTAAPVQASAPAKAPSK